MPGAMIPRKIRKKSNVHQSAFKVLAKTLTKLCCECSVEAHTHMCFNLTNSVQINRVSRRSTIGSAQREKENSCSCILPYRRSFSPEKKVMIKHSTQSFVLVCMGFGHSVKCVAKLLLVYNVGLLCSVEVDLGQLSWQEEQCVQYLGCCCR